MNQLKLHKKIEEFFKSDIKSASVKVAQSLLVNNDAKRFFFSKPMKLGLIGSGKMVFLMK